MYMCGKDVDDQTQLQYAGMLRIGALRFNSVLLCGLRADVGRVSTYPQYKYIVRWSFHFKHARNCSQCMGGLCKEHARVLSNLTWQRPLLILLIPILAWLLAHKVRLHRTHRAFNDLRD